MASGPRPQKDNCSYGAMELSAKSMGPSSLDIALQRRPAERGGEDVSLGEDFLETHHRPHRPKLQSRLKCGLRGSHEGNTGTTNWDPVSVIRCQVPDQRPRTSCRVVLTGEGHPPKPLRLRFSNEPPPSLQPRPGLRLDPGTVAIGAGPRRLADH